MQLFTLLALGITLVGLAIYKTVASYLELNSSRQPPGPMQVPFIGRIHDLPVKFVWLKFKEWADIYGKASGFYMTSVLGVKFLVVSDEKVAEELLVKRGRYNSDRPAVRSLFDSKSTHGSMEYLPLMGKNRECCAHGEAATASPLTNMARILGPPAQDIACVLDRGNQCPVPRHHVPREQALACPAYRKPRSVPGVS